MVVRAALPQIRGNLEDRDETCRILGSMGVTRK